MPEYLIESPHTKQECLQVIDDTFDKGMLGKFQFGCAAGNHRAWAFVKASNESGAKRKVPELVRKKARIVRVSRFTPRQVKSFHGM